MWQRDTSASATPAPAVAVVLVTALGAVPGPVVACCAGGADFAAAGLELAHWMTDPEGLFALTLSRRPRG